MSVTTIYLGVICILHGNHARNVHFGCFELTRIEHIWCLWLGVVIFGSYIWKDVENARTKTQSERWGTGIVVSCLKESSMRKDCLRST